MIYLNKNTKYILFLLIYICIQLNTQAQDANYSQFFNNPIYYNPAYVGINKGLRASLNYRNQWPNLPNDFRTYGFSIDIAERRIPGSGGIGLIFNKDVAGAGFLETTNAGLALSTRIPMGLKFYTQVGIMASIIQKSVDWTKFIFTDQLNPKYGNINNSNFVPLEQDNNVYPDFDIGAIFRFVDNKDISDAKTVGTIGVAAFHVFRPNESFFIENSNLERRIVIHMDVLFQNMDRYKKNRLKKKTTSRYTKINPGIIYQYQGEFQSFSLGLNIYKNPIYIGLWYRNEDFDFSKSETLIAMLGINANFGEDIRMKMLYSFDMSLQNNIVGAGGAHEFTLIFEFDSLELFSKSNSSSNFNRDMGNTRRKSNMDRLECSPF